MNNSLFRSTNLAKPPKICLPELPDEPPSPAACFLVSLTVTALPFPATNYAVHAVVHTQFPNMMIFFITFNIRLPEQSPGPQFGANNIDNPITWNTDTPNTIAVIDVKADDGSGFTIYAPQTFAP